MGKFIEQLGEQAATGVGAIQNSILGLILGKYNDKRQIKQQEKLQNLQIKGSKELTDYQAAKELQMWKDTSYGAQMEQLKNAGLNPGLIYGMSGGGGQTVGGSSATPTGATAQQGAGQEFGISMQMGMMAAQQRLLKAQADNLDADTAKKRGVDTTLAETQTLDLAQGIENKKAQQRLTQLQADYQETQNEIQKATKENAKEIIGFELQRLTNEVERLFRQNTIDKATMNDKINQFKADLAKTWATKYLTDAQTTTEQGKPAIQRAEIDKILTEIYQLTLRGEQEWRKLELAGADVETNRQKLNEEIFKNSGMPPRLIDDIIDLIILNRIGGKK